jgi:aspartate kinase
MLIIDLEKAVSDLTNLKDELAFERLVHDNNIAKISVIGTAMRTQSGIAKQMFEVLSEKQINMQVISTSEIKISVLIQADYTELAVRSLHDAFELDKIG